MEYGQDWFHLPLPPSASSTIRFRFSQTEYFSGETQTCPILNYAFLYRACFLFFLHQLGISLVYWLNLFKTHRVLFASTCTARWAKFYSIVYRILSWSARETHLRPMGFPKLTPHSISAVAHDAHIGIGQSCINNWLDFPILMQG